MSILELIKSRRSVRKFEVKSVPEDLLDQILEAGRWAPSGLNNQPWRFAVVRDEKLKKEFSCLTHYSKIVSDSDVLICVFIDNVKSYDRTKDVLAVGACIENMLLEIHALGLGAVWLGEILKNRELISEMLGLSEDLELLAVLALGYPAEKPRATRRKNIGELTVIKK